MTKSEYQIYLSSEHWKALKARKRSYDISKKKRIKCHICGTKANLHLHHKTYKRLGKEWLSDLVWLCGKCHSMVHEETRFDKELSVVEIKMNWVLRGKNKKEKPMIVNIKPSKLCPPVISPNGSIQGDLKGFSIYKQRRKLTSGEKPNQPGCSLAQAMAR